MNKKIDIGQNAKVLIRWNVPNMEPTKEQEKSMIALMAKKYGIPAKNIKIEKHVITNGVDDGTLVGNEIQNPNDPRFMQELMKKYIEINGIEGVDFNEIIKIDSQINSLIDFDIYGKSKKYVINWVKWSNFLSYGPDNYFDFRTLRGLVLLNGEPANKSGKSTFAYDLLHFLLFGKTNSNKAKTLGDLFNNYLPNERTLTVEGSITIDEENYLIRRTLTRPATGKKTKTITNKVEYYHLTPNGEEELLPEENEQGATTTATSKIIKEAIGNESDFDLIISANAKDLDALISLTETEKGRLLSRWIGLSAIEDKDIKAREKWNKEISVGRYSDMYNKVQLETDIEDLTKTNSELALEIEKNNATVNECEKKIAEYNKTRDTLLLSKQSIDENLLKVDITTLKSRLDSIVELGKRKKSELEIVENDIKSIGDIDYSEEEYKSMQKENNDLLSEIGGLKTIIKHLKEANNNLANAEYCPTCHRKLENVDNSELIAKNQKDIDEKITLGVEKKKRSDELTASMASIESKRDAYNKRSKLELKAAAIKSEMAAARAEWVEKNTLLKEVQQNKDAIQKNNEIDTTLNVINTNIRTEENIKRETSNAIISYNKEITKNTESIALRKSYLLKIEEERKTEKYWKLYLQMIGKDGISKMVLKNTLPIINNELARLLNDVTDFDVEVVMNEKNDVDFLLTRDDISYRLAAASGLEKTQAALALRVVLGKLSKLSRPPFILLDEVLGTVARENYDDMKILYDKIAEEYDFILHICHIDLDWYPEGNVVTVYKSNNISSIK